MQRDITIDFLKGIAIFLVVLGHLFPVPPVSNFIYSFHMPLFMFLSGCTFFYSFSHSNSAFQYLARHFFSLIVSYVVWAFVFYYVQNAKSFSFQDFLLSPISQKHFNHLWFLPTLFLIRMVFVCTERIVKNTRGGYECLVKS